MKKVTIDDVAKLAKSSKSTVSQYLNGRFNYMSIDTKRRIKEAIEELNYQPNFVARSLKQKKTSTIGVIVANILHVFSTEIIRAIEDFCQENNYHVIVCNADDNPEKEKQYIEMLRAKQVDGLIVFPTGKNIPLYERLIEGKYPLLFMDRIGLGAVGTTILLDNKKAVRLAIDHFITNNIRDIGIVTTLLSENLTPRIERIEGYKEGLIEHNLDINNDFIISEELNQIKDSVRKLIHSPKRPRGLIAANDLTLIKILELFREEDISIQSDIAVIGIDEVDFASAFQPTITTVEQPTFEMGKAAATLLLEKIESGKGLSHKTIRFEPKLNNRESSKLLE